MKKILTEAAAVGNATGRALPFRGRDKWAYYPGSSWQNMLFEGGYSFETPRPQVTPQGIKPYPRTGARTLDARTSFDHPPIVAVGGFVGSHPPRPRVVPSPDGS